MKRKGKIFLLIDWINDGKFFLEQELKRENISVELLDIPNYSMKDRTVKFRILNLYFKYIIQAIKALRMSIPEDTIVCWNFTTGIAIGLLNRFSFNKRTILALNMIAHPSSGFTSKIRYLIFHFVMNHPKFYLTVNASDYISINADRFNISPKKIFVLHDPVKKEFDFDIDIKDNHYVFSGGEAQRDWQLFFNVAAQMPDVSFVGVARRKFLSPGLIIPPNVKMEYDVDYQSFSQLMGASSIVILPLKSDLPCGLIVIGDAGLMNKPIIVTKTPSTTNYIIQNETGILVEMHNVAEMKKQIQHLLINESDRIRLGKNLNAYMAQEFSIQKYFKDFKSILNSIYD